MGTMIGSCVGSCAMTACCSAVSCRCLLSPVMSNLFYVLFLVLAAIAGVSLRYSGEDLNMGARIGTQDSSLCPGNDCDGIAFRICNAESCTGYWAVYRISFALSGFFVLMMLATACRSSFAAHVHRSYWFGKAFLVLAILGGCLFAPNALFAYYAWVARFLAPLFLVYQMICYIDFGYTTNQELLEKDEAEDDFLCCSNGGMKWKGLMLAVSLTLIVGSLVALGQLYHYYPSSCAFNGTAITTTLVFGLINTAVSISRIAEQGTIFVSALIFAYSTYLAFATVSAFPEPQCNRYLHSGGSETAWLVLSCFIAGASIGWMAFKLGKRQMGANAMSGKEPEPKDATDVVTVQVGEPARGGGSAVSLEPEAYLSYHFVMLLAALYTAMLLTDWGVAAASDAATKRYNVGYASAWLLMSSNWLCQLLYFWTLIAARVCPGRDFS